MKYDSGINPKAIIEALLFVSEKPLPLEQLKSALQGLSNDDIKNIVLELKNDYDKKDRGLRIEEIAGGFQIATSNEAAIPLREFFKQREAQKISSAALETLAIIAYKQPVTRLDIESLRGVNVDGVIKSLLDRGLIRISGRKDIIGRPFLYSTTKQFLEYFGLNSLDALPKIDEFNEISQSLTLPLSLSNLQEAASSAISAETAQCAVSAEPEITGGRNNESEGISKSTQANR